MARTRADFGGSERWLHVSGRLFVLLALALTLVRCGSDTGGALSVDPADASADQATSPQDTAARLRAHVALFAQPTPTAYHLQKLSAANPAHGFIASFDYGPVVLAVSDPETEDVAYELALRLTRWGRAGELSAVPPAAAPQTRDNRVEFRREAARLSLSEWYVNAPAGLEQGFTLPERPAGATPDAPVVLELTLEGDVEATADPTAQTVTLSVAGGRRTLLYDHLYVEDAAGTPLRAWFEVAGRTVSIHYDDAAATYPVRVDPTFTETSRMTASDGAAGDQYGDSVATEALGRVIVGAPTGDNVNGADAGAAYIYNSSGVEEARLLASSGAANDHFGEAVAIRGDFAAVSAPSAMGLPALNNAGAVYFYQRSGATWSQKSVGFGSQVGAFMGRALALNDGADVLAVGNDTRDQGGTTDTGAVLAYVRSGSTWSLQATKFASDSGAGDKLGTSVGAWGDTIIAGAPFWDSTADQGAAYVFVRSGTTWSQQARLSAGSGGRFGAAVAIYGDDALIGAPYCDSDGLSTDDGCAYIYHRTGTTWSLTHTLAASDHATNAHFGAEVAFYNGLALVSAPDAAGGGAAYLFSRSGSAWVEQGRLVVSGGSSGQSFGAGVAVNDSAFGDLQIFVGAPGYSSNKGAVYVFDGDYNGTSCSADGTCLSGNCRDGRCCESTCTTACRSCANPSGTCTTVVSGADDDNCNGSNTCDTSGACKKKTGQTCAVAADCASGYCVDGRCCGTACNGTCQTCAATPGTCTTLANADDPGTCAGASTCDASGACKAKNGQPCAAGSTCASTYCADGRCCDGACNGSCETCAATPGTCTPVTDAEDTPLCSAPNICDGAGSCGKKNGESCSVNGDCAYDYCVDNTCCATACTTPDACSGDASLTVFSCATGACAPSTAPCPNHLKCNAATNSCRTSCAADADCVSGYYCDGAQCQPKKSPGTGCASAHECNTSYCVDGVCCTSACTTADSCGGSVLSQWSCNGAGACVQQNTDCAPSACITDHCAGGCTTDTQCASGHYCDGTQCQAKKGRGVACTAANQCAEGFCVDGVCCNNACATPDVCTGTTLTLNSCSTGTCSSSATTCASHFACDETNDVCRTTCASDLECAPGHYCSGGQCKSQSPLGTTCTASTQCTSGHCVDGVCCNNACATPDDCTGTTHTVYTCSTGTCGSNTTSCASNFACDEANDVCRTTCSSDTDCADNYFCNGASLCQVKKSSGATCAGASECASAFCVDGVCCNQACATPDVCAGAQLTAYSCSDGTCDPVTSTCSDHLACDETNDVCRTACGGDLDCTAGYYCDGGQCKMKSPLGISCTAPNQCSSGFCVDGSCCNSACATPDDCTGTIFTAYSCSSGTCEDNATACGNHLACDETNDVCRSGCSATADCASGYFCNGSGQCEQQRSAGMACTAPAQCGASLYCVDGVCCTTACDTPDACASSTLTQYVCSGAGSCTRIDTSCSPNACNGAQCGGSCAQDTDCAAGFYCNGSSCTPKIANGAVCGGANQCASGFCADGRCCNEACSGADSCSGSTLTERRCDATPGQCTSENSSCSPFNCGSATSCGSGCSTDADCTSGYYCDGASGTCALRLEQGNPCLRDRQCQTGKYCVDGVCCNSTCSGTCQACRSDLKQAGVNGECGPARDGTDPHDTCVQQPTSGCGQTGACDGSGVCELYPYGTECAADTCSGTSLTEWECNGTGSCTSATSSCGAYACAGGTTCGTSCTSDANCSTSYYCEAGTCAPLLTLGKVCDRDRQCGAGTFCVDGVCCSSQCDGTCERCSATGSCVAVPDGEDTDDECAQDLGTGCGNDGECNGKRACRLKQGVPCGTTPQCSGNLEVHRTCDGSGNCDVSSQINCSPSVCSGGSCVSACTSDGDCQATHFCDAATNNCTLKRGSGAACTGANQCGSGFCVDGVCCASACDGLCEVCNSAGSCSAVPSGQDPDDDCAVGAECASDGECDGKRACRLQQGNACGATPFCDVGEQVDYACNGLGGCVEASRRNCAPNNCAAGRCTSTCTSDADCATGNFCDVAVGQCVPTRGVGVSCSAGTQCRSGFCADGVCCNTACGSPCVACSAALKEAGKDGECGPARGGTDPHDDCALEDPATCGRDGQCNGLGACRLHSAGVACGATQCVGNYVAGRVCNGTGTCVTDSGVPCLPYLCQATGCATTCATDAECLGDFYCSGAGVCEQKRMPGQSCTEPGGCLSGFCVDEVCCETECSGQCEACDVPGAEGMCLAITGAPHGDRAKCASGDPACAGACNGANRQTCAYPNSQTLCGESGCTGSSLTLARCDGAGACVADQARDCGAYGCDASALDCKTTCVTNADCAPGAECDTTANQCAFTAASCKDAFTVRNTDGTETSCAPYKCVAGACQATCAANVDCADGYECDGGACVERPGAQDGGGNGSGGAGANDGGPGSAPANVVEDGGCGCRITGSRESGAPWLLVFAGVSVFVGRRRRSRRRAAA